MKHASLPSKAGSYLEQVFIICARRDATFSKYIQIWVTFSPVVRNLLPKKAAAQPHPVYDQRRRTVWGWRHRLRGLAEDSKKIKKGRSQLTRAFPVTSLCVAQASFHFFPLLSRSGTSKSWRCLTGDNPYRQAHRHTPQHVGTPVDG